jgi:crotonobetainyl-CoA:carnitine CoA-transferase CaiB-like acyl-CoA transferase
VGREPDAGWEPEGGGPLTGIRILDLTRVIAGPVCTRTLAAWGAEVLRIDPPGFAEVPALLPETTTGKHCAAVDLRDPAGRGQLAALVGEADAIVHGLRPGALADLGFSDAELRRLNPGLCIAALDAYGWAGPWAGRRGFDSLVQFSCGIAAASAAAVGSDRPVPLPAQALDHATGYLLAAAVCRGLTGRYDGLAAADIRGALVGTANLLMEQHLSPPEESTPMPGLGAATTVRDTVWGPVSAVPQPGTIAGSGGNWRVPAGPLGRHAAIFTV